MGNVEIWELMLPMLWLGRRFLPDSCGHGKYRSAYSVVSTFLIYQTPMLALTTGPSCQTTRIYPYMGMFGGYPGPNSFEKLLTDTNSKQLIAESRPLAHGIYSAGGSSDLELNIKGKLVVETRNGQWLGIVKDGDIWQCFYGATAAGFGDPVKRDPLLVKKDLDNELLTVETARNIYCVDAQYHADGKEWIINEKGTAELRKRRRTERLAKGVPVKEWYHKRRQQLLNGEIPYLLRKMYNESLSRGEHWPREFRDFWCLPERFMFKEE
jgi:acetone carboxylase alpha subunit